MSRKSKAASQWPEVEWAQADLAMGYGLSEAVADVDVIIHAASDAGVTYEQATMSAFLRKTLLNHDGSVDVQGTKLLLEYARTAKVKQCILVQRVFPSRFLVAWQHVYNQRHCPSMLQHLLICHRSPKPQRYQLPLYRRPEKDVGKSQS